MGRLFGQFLDLIRSVCLSYAQQDHIARTDFAHDVFIDRNPASPDPLQDHSHAFYPYSNWLS
jgi:hypothetical protein